MLMGLTRLDLLFDEQNIKRNHGKGGTKMRPCPTIFEELSDFPKSLGEVEGNNPLQCT